MNANEIHRKVLGLSKQAKSFEIKNAYRKLVRKYHPDLNPPEQAKKNNAIMIRLNLAYHALMKEFKKTKHLPAEQNTNKAQEKQDEPMKKNPAGETLPALPKDPAYSYYKLAHQYFHRGFYKFYRRKSKLPMKLAAAMEILNNFQKACVYYGRVIEEFPDSVWRHDAAMKLDKIKQLTPIYSLISARLQELNKEEEIKLKTWQELDKKRGIYSYKDIERLSLQIWEVNKI